MKLSVYNGLETNKRAMTLGRVALIAGAHIFIIGGGYLATQYGSNLEEGGASMAGAVTWSSQSANAQEPTVDAGANSLFDDRAGNLAGYNAGEGQPTLLASNNEPTNAAPPTGRYAPRRPSGSSTLATTPASQSASDSVLRPLSSNSDSILYPARSPARPDESLSGTIEYKVQNGDSLWGISKRFNVSLAELTAANPGIKAPSIRVGQTIQIPRTSGSIASSGAPVAAPQSSAPRVSGRTYTVKSGDVLSKIASRQGVTVAELKAANGLSSDMIRIGQELVIPSSTRTETLVAQQHKGVTVTVEAGDTLDKFAALYGVSIRELMALNNIDNPRLIRIGQTLRIPESGSRQISEPTAQRSTPVTREPTRVPAQRQPVQSLDSLEVQDEPEDLPGLDAFGDSFDEGDLEEQPLIPIQE